MLRTPEPKEQARLLAKLLAEEGFVLAHQKALHVIAKLHGHRNWNVMQATSQKQAEPPMTEKFPAGQLIKRLVDAANDVIGNADDTGCGGDLTVTSASAVQRLQECVKAIEGGGLVPEEQATDKARYTVQGFGIGDVQSLRPDLSDEQALRVLEVANRNYDASVGLNWDVLEAHACSAFPVQGVVARLVDDKGHDEVVTVNLATGTIYLGRPEDLKGRVCKARTLGEAKHIHLASAHVSIDGYGQVALNGHSELFEASADELAECAEAIREAEKRDGVTHIVPLP